MQTNVNYQKIKTLADLREERLRIRYELCLSRKNMEDEKCIIRSMFTVDYLLSILSRKANWLYNGIVWGETAFNLVRSFFRKKSGDDREEEPLSEEEDGCSCP